MFYPIGFGGNHWFLYLIVPAIIGIWAQIRVTSAFNRWGKVRASSNITGAECAREILQAAQIHDVDVVQVDGFLGDHYDREHEASLSFQQCLQYAVGGGAWNCRARNRSCDPTRESLRTAQSADGDRTGHNGRLADVAVRHFRRAVVYESPDLITLGIYCYAILLVFQLITLPVEFDASRRAKIILQQMGIIQPGEEAAGVNNVLNAAALTYVAAFVAALGNLLWLMSIRDRRELMGRYSG